MTEHTAVLVSARTIAAGLTQGKDGRLQARILVLFSPARHPDHAGGGAALERWPVAIHDLFARGCVQLLVSSHNPASPSRGVSDPTEAPFQVRQAVPHPALRPGTPAGSGADPDLLCTLWTQVAGPDFADLAAALPLGGTVPPAGSPAAVVPNGRADAALVLSLVRARAIMDSLRRSDVPRRPPARPEKPAGDALLRAAASPSWEPEPGGPGARDMDLAAMLAAAEKAAGAQGKLASCTTSEGAAAARQGVKDERPKAAKDAAKAAAGERQGVDPLFSQARLAAGLDPRSAVGSTYSEKGNAALGRLFALQGFPSLQRLFNLCVEINVEVSKLAALTEGATPDRPNRYGFLSVALPCEVSAGTVWTTVKLRLPQGAIPGLFLPCPRGELDCASTGAPADAGLPRDGLLPLGAPHGDALPRFEVTTLDVPVALKRDIAASTRTDGQAPSTPVTRSAGLVLLDRHSAEAMQRRVAARSAPSGPVILDAEDLTVGYRLDIGLAVRGSPDKTEWRAMNRRTLTFDPPPPPPRTGATAAAHAAAVAASAKRLGGISVETVINRLYGPNGAARRAEADAAPVVRSAEKRSVKVKADDGTEKDRPVQVADEILLTLMSNPLGLDTSGGDVEVGESGLTKNINYDLPTSGPLPIPFYWSWAYWLGLATLFEGGYALSLDAAKDRYEHDGTLTFPPNQPHRLPWKARRQEAVGGPIVLPVPDGVRAVGNFPAPSVSDLVVRTAPDRSDLARPARVRRVLLPPTVAVDAAAAHDVFRDRRPDRVDGNGNIRSGLSGVDYDAVRETSPGLKQRGFPVALPPRSENGRLDWTLPPDILPAPGSDLPIGAGDIKDGAKSVFRPAIGGRRREQPILPDPVASHLVLCLARAGRTDSPLDGTLIGQPLIVPLYAVADGPGVVPRGFPNAVPLVLDLLRAGWDGRAGRPALRHASGGAVLRAWADGEALKLWAGKGLQVRHVIVELEPGEDVALLAWMLPTRAALIHAIEAVEATALLATSVGAGQTADEKFLDGLRALTGLPFTLPPPDVGSPLGPGGLPLPGPATLAAWATTLHDILQERPVPEIAGVTTLRLTHATTGVQPSDDAPSKAPVAFGQRPPPTLSREEPAPSKPPTVALKADFAVDLESVGAVTVLARGPGVARGIIDDPARGRSPTMRADGVWPPGQGQATLDNDPAKYFENLFGFAVAPNGRVTLPSEEVRLLRLKDLPEAPGAILGGSTVDIAANARISDGIGRETEPVLATGMAHRVTLVAAASSRTLGAFRTRDGEDVIGTPALATGPCVVLLASRRPDRVVLATGIAPSFRWDVSGSDPAAGQAVLTRHALLRITHANRGWYGAGPRERFGVVVWPPWIAGLDPRDMAGNRIARRYAGLPPMPLPALSDADLGPGGPFVTRWGADPIRGGDGPHGWLPPMAAFPGAQIWPNDESEEDPWALAPDGAVACDLPMPLPVVEAAVAGVGGTLNVSLVTYAPRFDPDRELWFADVEVTPRRPPAPGTDGPGVEDAAWPFLRLGVVRFQPDAPQALQVSEPIVAWGQVPPRRTLTVRAGDRAGLRKRLEITLEGPGTLPGPSLLGVAAGPKPGMTVSLLRYERVGTRVLTEPVRDSDGMPVTLSPAPLTAGASLTWKGELELPGEGGRFAVSVEEGEALPSAAGGQDLVTAPRFTAFLEVPA